MGSSILTEVPGDRASIGLPEAPTKPGAVGDQPPERGRSEQEWMPVSAGRRESLGRVHRLRFAREIAEVKAAGRAFRGDHCLMLVLARPGEPTRIGFVASRKGVGGAVQRNRARRRLREIVRRRWPRIPDSGYWILVIAHGSAIAAEHQDLATDVERLLAGAGALAPIGTVAE